MENTSLRNWTPLFLLKEQTWLRLQQKYNMKASEVSTLQLVLMNSAAGVGLCHVFIG